MSEINIFYCLLFYWGEEGIRIGKGGERRKFEREQNM
jgi:hypothetical protein